MRNFTIQCDGSSLSVLIDGELSTVQWDHEDTMEVTQFNYVDVNNVLPMCIINRIDDEYELTDEEVDSLREQIVVCIQKTGGITDYRNPHLSR